MQSRSATYLMLPHVHVVHVKKGYGVSVLIIIENHADLVEQQLDVESRRLFGRFVVHDDLRIESV